MSNFWDEFEKIDVSHQTARKEFMTKQVNKMSLEDKIIWANGRIKEFIDYCKANNLGEPRVSFSGGKDSTILLDLVKKQLPNVKCIVGAEFFHPDNAVLISKIQNKEMYAPKKNFDWVIDNIGYPIISKELSQKINFVRNTKTFGNYILVNFGLRFFRKIAKKYLHMLDKEFVPYEITHKCCDLIKGGVKHNKEPKFVGTSIFESELRKTNWLIKGCNVYDKGDTKSRPLSIWTDKDVFDYAKKYNVELSKAYEKGWERTGCLCCGFGANLESRTNEILEKQTGKKHWNRFELLKQHFPLVYEKYIWEKGMYRALADSYVPIRNDEKYMEYYNNRQKEIKLWYNDLYNNINKILNEIEIRTGGKFTLEQKEQIYKIYNVKKGGE